MASFYHVTYDVLVATDQHRMAPLILYNIIITYHRCALYNNRTCLNHYIIIIINHVSHFYQCQKSRDFRENKMGRGCRMLYNLLDNMFV